MTDPSEYADASPFSHVSAGDPPFLIFQGSADRLVLPSQSRGLAQRLTATGVPNRLVMIHGAVHGFGFQVNGRNLLGPISRFLRAAMG